MRTIFLIAVFVRPLVLAGKFSWLKKNKKEKPDDNSASNRHSENDYTTADDPTESLSEPNIPLRESADYINDRWSALESRFDAFEFILNQLHSKLEDIHSDIRSLSKQRSNSVTRGPNQDTLSRAERLDFPPLPPTLPGSAGPSRSADTQVDSSTGAGLLGELQSAISRRSMTNNAHEDKHPNTETVAKQSNGNDSFAAAPPPPPPPPIRDDFAPLTGISQKYVGAHMVRASPGAPGVTDHKHGRASVVSKGEDFDGSTKAVQQDSNSPGVGFLEELMSAVHKRRRAAIPPV
jgi:hypothetical protein